MMAKISHGARLVYAVLKRPSVSGWITQKELAEATDLSLEEVRIGIEDLIEGPLSESPMIIEKRVNDRGASEYHLVDEAQVVENILLALEQRETMTPDQLVEKSGLSLEQVEEGLNKLLNHGVGSVVEDTQPQTVHVPAFRIRVEEDAGYEVFDYYNDDY